MGRVEWEDTYFAIQTYNGIGYDADYTDTLDAALERYDEIKKRKGKVKVMVSKVINKMRRNKEDNGDELVAHMVEEIKDF